MRAHYLKILKGNVRATVYAGKQPLEFNWPEGVTISVVSEEPAENIVGGFDELKPKPGMESIEIWPIR